VPPAPYWTDPWRGKDRIIAAIRRWAETHAGEPPSADAWARPLSPQRKGPRGRTRPSTWTVRQAFGSFSAAVEAAGYTPRPQGEQGRRELCKAGMHELAGANVWESPTSGLRICKACRRARDQAPARERARQRDRKAARYARLKDAGLCVRCGKHPAEPDRACCADCLGYLREADARRRRAA
jgi:hypothetical protein